VISTISVNFAIAVIKVNVFGTGFGSSHIAASFGSMLKVTPRMDEQKSRLLTNREQPCG
jgi:hypothetical protein